MLGEDPIGADRKVLSRTINKAGWYFQAAYKLGFLLQGLQIAARYSSWDPDTDKDDNEETQLSVACVYDISKHARLLIDYTKNIEKPTDLDNDIITFRYQIKF